MIAAPEVRRTGHPRLVRVLQAVLWAAIVVVLSIGVGVFAIQFSEYETRWLAFAMAGLVLAAGVVLTDVRTALLAYFVLGLSVDAHYYVTQPMQTMYVGNSGPTAISIPLSMIPAVGLLVRQAFLCYLGASRFHWGSQIGRPALFLIAMTLLAAAASSLRFLGLCVVMQLIWLYVAFLAICNTVRTREDVIFVVRLLLLVLFIQCMIFFLQIVTGVKFSAVGKVEISEAAGQSIWHAATGTAAITTAAFATFIEPLVMLAFALWRTGRTEFGKWTPLVASVGAVVTVLTLNRSSWIGLLLGLSIVELVLRARGLVAHYKLGWRLLVLLGGLGLLFTVGLSLLESKRQQDHGKDWSQRFDLMKPATRMITGNPVFGVGPGGYGYNLPRYSYGFSGWLYIVHNDYLLIWAERGTLGFVAFLLWLRAALRLARAGTRWPVAPFNVMAAGVLGGIVVHMWEIFWSSTMSLPAYGVLWVLLALLIVSGDIVRDSVRTDTPAQVAS